MSIEVPKISPSSPYLAVIAAVQLPSITEAEFQSSLAELRELAKTLGYQVVQTFTQNRNGIDVQGYIGSGKRDEITAFVNSPSDTDPPITALFVDHEISPTQAHNLEKQVGCTVMDRTMVILEIFHRNARTREARAQVEIAQLEYMAPRLREAARLAGPQGRQRSGVGGRGAGEGHMELDKRKIRDRIAQLKLDLVGLETERQTQRSRRLGRQGGPSDQHHYSVALVGYTNAGKSTLMRALTDSEVLVANKLFATLDTTVRALHPESIPKVLVSDTVGFIKNLPHDLVASFKSTLDEALDASLLLHVIDASDPGFERQLAVTDAVLKDIKADEVPRIRVFNKIDFVGDEAAQAERTAQLQARYADCIVMSAYREEDIASLHKSIVAFFQKSLVQAELFLPWSGQSLRGKIFSICEVLSERADENGAFLTIKAESSAIDQLRKQINELQ